MMGLVRSDVIIYRFIGIALVVVSSAVCGHGGGLIKTEDIMIEKMVNTIVIVNPVCALNPRLHVQFVDTFLLNFIPFARPPFLPGRFRHAATSPRMLCPCANPKPREPSLHGNAKFYAEYKWLYRDWK